MNAHKYRTAVNSLPYGKRLPSAVYLLDLPDQRIPPVLRKVCDQLRTRLQIGPEFNLLKFHLDSPKISFLAYPDFLTDPHPELQASVVVDLVTGRLRHDDYSGRANPPILHRKDTFPSARSNGFSGFSEADEGRREGGSAR